MIWIASVPDEIAPNPLQTLSHGARDLFDDVGVRASSFVFGSSRGIYKRKNVRMAVIGRDTNGQFRSLHQYPRTKRPAVRILQDPSERLFLWSVGYKSINNLISTAHRPTAHRAVHRIRRSERPDRVSRYFCRSDQVDNQDIEIVYTAIDWSMVHYETGELIRRKALLHAYNCDGTPLEKPVVYPRIRRNEDGLELVAR